MNPCLLLILLISLSTPIYAEEANTNWDNVSLETKTTCKSVQNTAIEPSSTNTNDCDVLNLYYGFDNPPDYTAAKQCALGHKDYDVLAMIYANGLGVKPNLDLAIYYACQMDAAPAEMDGRIEHLAQMKTLRDSKKPFDICDDITSGYMMGWCASIDHRMEQAKTTKEISTTVSQWTATEQQAFEPLLQASSNFSKVRSNNEIDLTGSGRAAFAIQEQMSLTQEFLTLLKQANSCQFPAASTQELNNADKELNQIYMNLQKSTLTSFTTITHQGIKNTERAWIGYRDSWVNFIKVKCPNVQTKLIETLITQQRIKQLHELEQFIDR